MQEEQDIRQIIEENQALRQELDNIRSARTNRLRKGWWFTRKIGSAFAGSWLRNSMLKLYQEIPDKNIQKETLADVSASLFWRLTRFGVIAILLALLPTAILLFQTNLLLRQNKILKKQNYRLDQQTNLHEAQRRSSLVFVLAELMNEMHAEAGRNSGTINDGLIARVAGLSQSLIPYRFLEEDKLTSRAYSPEKAQLFLNIVLSDLSSSSKAALFQRSDFSNSDLKGAELNLTKVNDCRLHHSRLDEARLFNAEWSSIDFKGASFKQAWIEGSAFTSCEWKASDMRMLSLFNTVFIQSAFEMADMSSSVLHDVRFMNCSIDQLDLSGSILSNVSFGAGTVAKGLNLTGTYVIQPDWLDQQKGWEGAEDLRKAYKLGSAIEWNELSVSSIAIDRLRAIHPGSKLYPIKPK